MNTIKRFYALDAFRGLAALLVFLYHMPNLSIITGNPFVRGSAIFVDLFFVLSGFVIYHNYKNKIQSLNLGKAFIIKRLKRIFPLHIYTLLIILVLEIIKFYIHDYLPFSRPPFETNTMDSFWVQVFLLNSTPLFSGFMWKRSKLVNKCRNANLYILFIITSIMCFNKKRATFIISCLIIISGYLFFIINYSSFNLAADFNFSFIRGFVGFLYRCNHLHFKKLYYYFHLQYFNYFL